MHGARDPRSWWSDHGRHRYCSKGGRGRSWLVQKEDGTLARAKELDSDPWASMRRIKRTKIKEERAAVILEQRSWVVEEHEHVRKERVKDLFDGDRAFRESLSCLIHLCLPID